MANAVLHNISVERIKEPVINNRQLSVLGADIFCVWTAWKTLGPQLVRSFSMVNSNVSCVIGGTCVGSIISLRENVLLAELGETKWFAPSTKLSGPPGVGVGLGAWVGVGSRAICPVRPTALGLTP